MVTTHDGASPITQGVVPLLVYDLWEHACHPDHKNDRAAFLAAWRGQLACWRFAGRQYAAATGVGEAWRHPQSVEPALS